jgi:hypothetical protein
MATAPRADGVEVIASAVAAAFEALLAAGRMRLETDD